MARLANRRMPKARGTRGLELMTARGEAGRKTVMRTIPSVVRELMLLPTLTPEDEKRLLEAQRNNKASE